jgi:hypothetical protein
MTAELGFARREPQKPTPFRDQYIRNRKPGSGLRFAILECAKNDLLINRQLVPSFDANSTASMEKVFGFKDDVDVRRGGLSDVSIRLKERQNRACVLRLSSESRTVKHDLW